MKSENRGGENKRKRREDAKRKGQKQKVGRSGKKRKTNAFWKEALRGGKGRQGDGAMQHTRSLVLSLSFLLTDDARPLATQLVSQWIPCGTHSNDELFARCCCFPIFTHVFFFFWYISSCLGIECPFNWIAMIARTQLQLQLQPPSPTPIDFPTQHCHFFFPFFPDGG